MKVDSWLFMERVKLQMFKDFLCRFVEVKAQELVDFISLNIIEY